MPGGPRLLILGLDGATFDVLDPLIEAGELPALRSLRSTAAYGRLKSTIPFITPAAWMALATGKNPGKTGIFDFRNLRGPGMRLVPVSSRDYAKGGAMWHYLNAGGLRVGILNYPMLYPAYPIEGFMVGGVGSSLDGALTSPPDLKRELDRITGGYDVMVPFMAYAALDMSTRAGNIGQFLRDLDRLTTKHERALLHLLGQGETDVFIAVLMTADFLQHVLWDAWEGSPAGGDGPRAEFVGVWRRLDRIVGEALDRLGPESYAIVLSDHGFGSYRKSFLINQWLEDEGFLVRRKTRTPRKSDAFYAFRDLPPIRFLARRAPVLSKRIAGALFPPFGDSIDLERSTAFALDHSHVGHVYVNSHWRTGAGPIIDRGRYSAVRDDLMRRLDVFLRDSGQVGTVEIFAASELYQGSMVEMLPDVIFTLDGGACEAAVTRFGHPVFQSPTNRNRTGNHRRDGIFFCRGPHIQPGPLPIVDIVDIAPTILFLAGCPAPADMDGRLIEAMLDPEMRAVRVPPAAADVIPPAAGLVREDEADVERRLRQLGYLE
jgi:predicted AlkP superfamily phosphohydrolase/phosphomutase